MATVAEQLRRAREEQKLTVYQVAEVTKIKTEHIRALEAGDYDAFSAPVYIRGFVRTYAKHLKLDAAQVAQTLDAELGQTRKFREPPSLTPAGRTPLDFLMLQLTKLNRAWVLVVLAFVLIVVVLAVIVRTYSGRVRSDPLKKLGPGLYQPTQHQSGEYLPLPPAQTPRR